MLSGWLNDIFFPLSGGEVLMTRKPKTKDPTEDVKTTQTVEFSACMAEKGCKKKSKCLRYAQFSGKVAYSGFHNHHLCKTDSFEFFLPLKA